MVNVALGTRDNLCGNDLDARRLQLADERVEVRHAEAQMVDRTAVALAGRVLLA